MPLEIAGALVAGVGALAFPEINGLAAQGFGATANTVDPCTTRHAHLPSGAAAPHGTRYRPLAPKTLGDNVIAWWAIAPVARLCAGRRYHRDEQPGCRDAQKRRSPNFEHFVSPGHAEPIDVGTRKISFATD